VYDLTISLPPSVQQSLCPSPHVLASGPPSSTGGTCSTG